jgi:hypothetical protein
MYLQVRGIPWYVSHFGSPSLHSTLSCIYATTLQERSDESKCDICLHCIFLQQKLWLGSSRYTHDIIKLSMPTDYIICISIINHSSPSIWFSLMHILYICGTFTVYIFSTLHKYDFCSCCAFLSHKQTKFQGLEVRQYAALFLCVRTRKLEQCECCVFIIVVYYSITVKVECVKL